MGFYGNITNTAKTQFTFDRTYPNRKTMDSRLSTDEIYLGRYVLIEYDLNNKETLDTFLRVWYNTSTGSYYTTQRFDEATRVRYTNTEDPNNPGHGLDNAVILDQLVYTMDSNEVQTFYKCTGSVGDGKGGYYATFSPVIYSENNYTQNYNIDINCYGEGRGYDSTVWQKVYTHGVEKFVMIAELNTVVPTFDVVADAPSMSPVQPHFDANSTNVYYKLHWQPQWGVRVAEAAPDNKGVVRSDTKTIWARERYETATGKTIKEYYDAASDTWVKYNPAANINDYYVPEAANNVPAAIYFNAAALESQVDESRESPNGLNKIDIEDDNYITLLPTGKSGNQYPLHDGSSRTNDAVDIQEFRINLPAIGNTISTVWDIVHGPSRNNDPANSLQGRLNFFTKMYPQEIPVQSTGGYLVGSTVTGDAWIQPTVNVEVLEGDSRYHQNAITIVHTKKVGKELETFSCKNGGTLEGLALGSNHGKGDTLKLYTPQLDEMGHVIGHIIETVTLPFGYKKYETSGLEESTDDLYTSIVEDVNGAHTSTASANLSETIASETQDTLTVAPGNKWIQTKFDDDKLTIAHEIHAIPTDSNDPTNANADDNAVDENNLNIPDWSYDAAGHITGKHDHYYTLPYGYKNITPGAFSSEVAEITSNTTSIIADNTQDTLIIAPGNKWVRIAGDNSNDTLTIAHEVHEIKKDAKDATPLDGVGTFTVQDLIFDEAGHVTANQAHGYALPYAIRNISVKGSEAVTGGTTAEGTVEADAYNYTLNLNAQNRWINLKVDNNAISIGHAAAGNEITTAGDTTASTPNFGDTFNVPYIKYDEMGHIASSNVRTVKIPQGSLTDTASTDTANVLTSIDLNETTGAITTTHQNVGTLKLTNYNTVNTVDTTFIQATDTINQAFNKIDSRFESLDLDDVASSDGSQIVYTVKQNNGKITVEHKKIGELILTDYKLPTAVSDNGKILETESLNTAIGKIEFRVNAEQARATDAEQKLSQKIDDTIEGLDVDSIVADGYSFISEVSEANGKIAANTAYLEDVKLKTAVPLSSSDNIAVNDTLSQALGKLQAQIDINETAIKTLNDGIDPDKIDSVKDLITYTEEHGETTKGILDAIGKKASTDENGNPIASTGIYSLIDAEAAARKTLVSNVQADWNATEGLAVILNKPTNLVTSDQITNMVENEDIQDMITKSDSFTYRELFDKAGNSISLETTLTIQALLNKVAELEERIYALEHPDIQAPTEEGGEETPTE